MNVHPYREWDTKEQRKAGQKSVAPAYSEGLVQIFAK